MFSFTGRNNSNISWIDQIDSILGLRSLPFGTVGIIFGFLLVIAGIYFTIISNRSLLAVGRGTFAFKLTKNVVNDGIYKRSRNPMALGYYLLCLGIGLMGNSTYVTLGSLIVLIPVHIFYIKYFEEVELENRYGSSYLEYKKTVPFLIPAKNKGVWR